MGEAILTRSGGQGEAEAILPITPGACTLLVSVKDSLNRPAVGVQVNCKDGGSWYNYTTNDKGQCMFSTNSGSANITVFNRYKNNIWILDQQKKTIDIDAPISSSNRINIQFEGYKAGTELNFVSPSGSAPTASALPTGNYAFMVSKKIHVFVGGGGGGGVGTYTYTGIYEGGGAGGANDANITINAGQVYYGYIGQGGRGGYTTEDYNPSAAIGGTGGTTSFANISAGGGISAGNNGYGKYHTGRYWQSSSISNFGGGGGGTTEVEDGRYNTPHPAGSPGGGSGGQTIIENGYSEGGSGGSPGRDGLGGGGGGAGWYWRGRYSGGKGGNGCIRIKFLE